MAVEMLYLIFHHLLSGFLSVLYSFLMIKESTTKQIGPKVICLNNYVHEY